MTLPFLHPFSAIIAGPSQAGKSQWIAKLLTYRNQMIEPTPVKTYFCYSEWQPLYDSFDNIEFHQGLIDVDSLDNSIPKLLILDDLMDVLNSKEGQKIADIFTKHSHHKNISIFLITQNIFQKGSHNRVCQLNCHYQILFNNPRDKTQIRFLSRQMYPAPGQSSFMVQAFEDAVSVKYSPLIVDLKQQTEDILRLRTGIFPDENTYIYITRQTANQLTSASRCVKNEQEAQEKR